MCDEQTEKDNEAFARAGGQLNRRDFGLLGSAAFFASAFPALAKAEADGSIAVIETDVDVPMTEGVSDCLYVRPATGSHPGVLMWPDIRGLRPAFRAMAKRLAMSGYAVLVVNPFYRDAKAPVVKPGEQFSDPDVRSRVIPMYRKLTHTNSMSDARDYIAFIDKQEGVDTARKIGTCG